MTQPFYKHELFAKIIFIAAVVSCATPWVNPPLALLIGFAISQSIGHPFQKYNSKATKYLLQISVVGLGFGMNIYEAAKAGKQGFVFTAASISITIIVGLIVGKVFKMNQKTSLLISSGTAICGGSAIAAVAPIIEAKEDEISISLGTVFILNSLALLIFPFVGHYFNLSQSQFGLWVAIAIHDTSSVVGTASQYGAEALKIATTVKLERALWIIPLSIVVAFIYRQQKNKIKIPWFILLFVAAMLVNTFFPVLHAANSIIVLIAKKGLTITLLLIGAGLSRTAIKNVGVKPLVLGVLLWILISVGSIIVIINM
ncbi:MAG: hypothetical protein RJA07_1506 [Bacteroidota bacterium]|jgi:uncharacterized integral membrane protein (TIGR00698 family)